MALKMVDTSNILKALGMQDLEPVLKDAGVQIAFSMTGVVVYNSKTVVKVALDNDKVKILIAGGTWVTYEVVAEQVKLLFEGLKKVIPLEKLAVASKASKAMAPMKSDPSVFAPKEFGDSALGEVSTEGSPNKKGVKASIKPVKKMVWEKKDDDPVSEEPIKPPEGSPKKGFTKEEKATSHKKACEDTKTVLDGFNEPQVKLSKATMLFQPVSSTSSGSTYYVVALNPNLKIAARYKGTSLSVRAEGDINKYHDKLVEVGFSISSGGSHASFHCEAEGCLWKKAIGAAILGLGLDFETFTSLDALEGKGA